MGSRVRMYSENEVDKPYEVYARINELRYDLGVKPDHVFTLEEIKAIRKELKKNLKDYKAEVKARGRNNFKSLEDFPFEGRPTDPRLFELYSDEEILDFLNGMACRDDKTLRMEHFLEDARPIEPSFALSTDSKPSLSADYFVGRGSGRSV